MHVFFYHNDISVYTESTFSVAGGSLTKNKTTLVHVYAWAFLATYYWEHRFKWKTYLCDPTLLNNCLTKAIMKQTSSRLHAAAIFTTLETIPSLLNAKSVFTHKFYILTSIHITHKPYSHFSAQRFHLCLPQRQYRLSFPFPPPETYISCIDSQVSSLAHCFKRLSGIEALPSNEPLE